MNAITDADEDAREIDEIVRKATEGFAADVRAIIARHTKPRRFARPPKDLTERMVRYFQAVARHPDHLVPSDMAEALSIARALADGDLP